MLLLGTGFFFHHYYTELLSRKEAGFLLSFRKRRNNRDPKLFLSAVARRPCSLLFCVADPAFFGLPSALRIPRCDTGPGAAFFKKSRQPASSGGDGKNILIVREAASSVLT
jgi:hypothetical protein